MILNLSRGYKLRRQIGKALKARSKAVSSAVKRYNDAAGKLNRPILEVEEVLSYVFLGQFDLLRDSRNEIMKKPWSRNAEREAAVKFFKLERAREEIRRLTVELRRLHAYSTTTSARMNVIIADATGRDPLLAFQLQKREQRRLVVCNTHLQHLSAINTWAKFLQPQDDLGRSVFDAETDVDAVEDIIRCTETRELELESAEIDAEIEKVGFSESLAILSMND